MSEVYDTIRIHIQKQRYSYSFAFPLRWFIIDVRCVFYARAFVSMCFCTECAVKKNEEMLDNNKFPRRPISHQIFVSSLGDDGKHEMSRQLS